MLYGGANDPGRDTGRLFKKQTMPYKEKDIELVYWTPEQAAKKFATAQSHLRHIEDELGMKVLRGKRGIRVMRKYTKSQMEIFGKIITLNNLSVPLQTIKEYGIKNLDLMIDFFSKLK